MRVLATWLLALSLAVFPAGAAHSEDATVDPGASEGAPEQPAPAPPSSPEASSPPVVPSPETASSSPTPTREGPATAPAPAAPPPRGNPNGNDHQRVAAAESHSNPDTLSRLATDGNDYVRLAVANNPNASSEQLQRLAQDGNYWVAKAARESLEKMQQQQPQPALPQPQEPVAPSVAPSVAAAPTVGPSKISTPAPTLRPTGNPAGNDRQRVMAAETYSNSKVLSSLAKDGNDYVRLAVAGNANTSISDLNKLAQDGNVYVAAAAQATLVELQGTSAVSPPQPQREVSPSPTTPTPAPSISLRPSPSPTRSPSPTAISAPTRSPSPLISPSAVASLPTGVSPSRLGNDRQRVQLAEGNVSTQVLGVLAQDANDFVRLAVAENDKTSVSDLQKLAQDGNVYVAAAAKETLSSVLASPSANVARPSSAPTLSGQAPSALSAVVAQTLARPELDRAQTAASTLNSQVLAELATDSSELVRLNAASNSATPVSQLLALAQDENVVVAATAQATLVGSGVDAVNTDGTGISTPAPLEISQPMPAIRTGNPNGSDSQRVDAAKSWTSPETLQVLAVDRNDLVRLAVAANSNTSRETLEELVEDPNPVVSAAASLALDAREDPSGTGSVDGPSAAGSTAGIPEFVLRVPLASAIWSWFQPSEPNEASVDERITRARTSDSVDEINQLAVDPDPAVRQAVLENPSASLTSLVALSVDGDPNIASYALTRLAGTEPLPVESGAAGPLETLVGFLAGMFSPETEPTAPPTREPVYELPVPVREGLAASLSASPGAQALIRVLSKDEDTNVRGLIARNPFTPASVLDDLAADPSPEVAHLAAWRTFLNTNPDAELVLGSGSVLPTPIGGYFEGIPEATSERVALAGRTFIGSAVLAQLALDSEPSVREAVAGNPHTSVETLHRLVSDTDVEVALAAHNSLATRNVTDNSARDWLIRASGVMNEYATANPWITTLDEHAAQISDRRSQLTSWGALVARTHNAVEVQRLTGDSGAFSDLGTPFVDLLEKVNGAYVSQERNLPGNVKDPNDNRLRTNGDLLIPELGQARGSRITEPYLTSESLTPNLCRVNGAAIQGNAFGSCVIETSLKHPESGEVLGVFLSTVEVGEPSGVVNFFMVDYVEGLKALQSKREEWSNGASAKPSFETWTEQDVAEVLDQGNLSRRCFNLAPSANECLVENAVLADAATAALARSQLQRVYGNTSVSNEVRESLVSYIVALDEMNLVGDEITTHVSSWTKPTSSFTQRITIKLPDVPEGLKTTLQVVGNGRGCQVRDGAIMTSIAPSSRQSNTCLVQLVVSGDQLGGESVSVLKVVRPGLAYA